MNFKILVVVHIIWYTCGSTASGIYLHPRILHEFSCLLKSPGWMDWNEMSHSLCTQIKRSLFFLFFFARCWIWVVLEIASGHFFIYFQVSVLVQLLFSFFFQFQRAGIWGTHSKFLFGLPKGPWVFVETPGWMDWKGHAKFILHTNRAKIIISGLVAEYELRLKLHQGPFFFSKNSARFLLLFSAIPKAIWKTRLKCFFGLPKGPWIVHLNGSSGLFLFRWEFRLHSWCCLCLAFCL